MNSAVIPTIGRMPVAAEDVKGEPTPTGTPPIAGRWTQFVAAVAEWPGRRGKGGAPLGS